MMIPEVDKSDLSTYFLSYGDVDTPKDEEDVRTMSLEDLLKDIRSM